MKLKMNKNLIKILLILIIGIVIIFLVKFLITKNSKSEDGIEQPTTEISYKNKISESKYNTEAINNYITELETLNQKLDEINSQKRDIEAKISDLKNKINTSTDYAFEEEIYSETAETE